MYLVLDLPAFIIRGPFPPVFTKSHSWPVIGFGKEDDKTVYSGGGCCDGPRRTKLMAIPCAFAQSQDERLRFFCPFSLPLPGIKAPVTRRGRIDAVSGDLVKDSPFLL